MKWVIDKWYELLIFAVLGIVGIATVFKFQEILNLIGIEWMITISSVVYFIASRFIGREKKDYTEISSQSSFFKALGKFGEALIGITTAVLILFVIIMTPAYYILKNTLGKPAIYLVIFAFLLGFLISVRLSSFNERQEKGKLAEFLRNYSDIGIIILIWASNYLI